MEKVLNLTQHVATPEQIEAGIIEPSHKEEIRKLLTFDSLPTREVIEERASALATLAHQLQPSGSVMIGGAPFLMSALERKLRERGLTPVYAFSVRESIEEMLHDGSVSKRALFRHIGFVEVL